MRPATSSRGTPISARSAAARFATVYRAIENETGRPVALKILHVDAVSGRLLETFTKETRALARVSDHPNIVTLYRPLTTSDGRPVLVLELCRESMAQRLRRTGPVGAQEATRIAIKIAGALETAHRYGFLHRDLKPQNILITQFGEPALGDFGVAALQATAQASTGLFGFTTLHAAPEALEGNALSPATDVYGLASSMYQLLGGVAPFAAYDNEAPASVILRIIRDPVRPLRVEGVPFELSDVLESALAKQPESRPQTAADLAAALSAIEVANGWPSTTFVAWDAEPSPPAAARIRPRRDSAPPAPPAPASPPAAGGPPVAAAPPMSPPLRPSPSVGLAEGNDHGPAAGARSDADQAVEIAGGLPARPAAGPDSRSDRPVRPDSRSDRPVGPDSRSDRPVGPDSRSDRPVGPDPVDRPVGPDSRSDRPSGPFRSGFLPLHRRLHRPRRPGWGRRSLRPPAAAARWCRRASLAVATPARPSRRPPIRRSPLFRRHPTRRGPGRCSWTPRGRLGGRTQWRLRARTNRLFSPPPAGWLRLGARRRRGDYPGSRFRWYGVPVWSPPSWCSSPPSSWWPAFCSAADPRPPKRRELLSTGLESRR